MNLEKINPFVAKLIQTCLDIESGVKLAPAENIKILEREYMHFSNDERKQINEFLYNNYGNEDLIWLLSVLINYSKEEEIGRSLLKLLCETNYDDVRVDGMLEYQIRRRIKGEYVLRRELRRKNAKRYAEIFAGLSYIPKEDRQKKKIVIATSQLLGIRHAPTQVILSTAYTLQQHMGYEVFIFIFPSNYLIGNDIFWQREVENCSDTSDGDFYKIAYNDTSFVCYQVETKNDQFLLNYQKALLLVQTIKPMFVFEMGCNNAFSECFSGITDTVAMSMDTIYPPTSDAKILIRLDATHSDSKIEEYLMDRGQISVVPKYHLPITIDMGGKVTTRAQEGLSENKFLVAIVGNRLDKEMDEDFLNLLIRASDRCEKIEYVFIGEIYNKERILNTALSEKIHFAGYKEDLYSVYKVMDVYLNPKREGGGFSSAIALAAGLPVITLPECDVAYNVGKAFEVNDYEGMLNELCRYVEDREYYANKRKEATNQYEIEIKRRNEYFVEDLLNQVIPILC